MPPPNAEERRGLVLHFARRCSLPPEAIASLLTRVGAQAAAGDDVGDAQADVSTGTSAGADTGIFTGTSAGACMGLGPALGSQGQGNVRGDGDEDEDEGSDAWSGADIENLCREEAMKLLRNKLSQAHTSI